MRRVTTGTHSFKFKTTHRKCVASPKRSFCKPVHIRDLSSVRDELFKLPRSNIIASNRDCDVVIQSICAI
eukprot:scaffold305150_cov21-Prasinocladus_malaysianus.AAC.1